MENNTENSGSVKQLTREQRRYQERTAELAMRQFNSMCKRFQDFIYGTDDLEEYEVRQRIKEMNAKWQLFRKEYRLSEDSKTIMLDYCNKLYQMYLDELNAPEAANSTEKSAL